MQEYIIEQDKTFISQEDNLTLFYDIYMPKTFTSPIVIQIAHGMVEHKGRYEWVGISFAKAGFIVVINDHRGHGKSIDSLHQWGEMKGIDMPKNTKSGFERAVADMYQLTLIAKERFKPDEYILLGHSMGSLLARSYIKYHKHALDALILSGSPAYNSLVGVGKHIAQLLHKFGFEEWGKHFINGLSFGGFNRAFSHNHDEDYVKGGFAWLCSDKEVVAAYKADNACQFVFSLQSFIGLFEGMQWVNDTYSLMGDGFPIFIISGSDDSCGKFGIGVEAIAKLYEKCGFNVKLKLYSGARHEILNEVNKEEVLLDVLNFIQNKGFS